VTVNCRRARRLVQDLLDGCLANPTELDQHLATCQACRTHLARLQRLSAAVAGDVRCSPDEARLERVTAGVEGAIAAERRAQEPTGRGRPWRALVAAAMLGVFALGLLAGRMVWPRETVVTQVQRVVQTKLVHDRVEVPVIRERVVRKIVRVPVVRTRLVIRYLPPPALPAGAGGANLALGFGASLASPEPEPIRVYLPAPAQPAQIEYSESVRLAALAGDRPQR
jgi:anti-sigma factor RsiW